MRYVVFSLGLLATHSVVRAAFLNTNCSSSSSSVGLYGNPSCPCVGIDNLKGYYATQQDAYHVQYSAEAGATCNTWEMGMHPECRGGFYNGPAWCRQSWCYVDPCNCHLDVPPKMTNAGIEWQGRPAYWSYRTCGGIDLYTAEMNKDACIMQSTESACSRNPKCAWDGKRCGGKEVVSGCGAHAEKYPAEYGQEDCRCVGLGGRYPGKAFMYIDDANLARYDPNVGSKCQAWDLDAHPECLKDGAKPEWCSLKWCFVDPCKCKTKVPPKAVMGQNKVMMFQGRLAHWSAETCGNEDVWSSNHSEMDVLGVSLEELCAKPGVESDAPRISFLALIAALGVAII